MSGQVQPLPARMLGPASARRSERVPRTWPRRRTAIAVLVGVLAVWGALVATHRTTRLLPISRAAVLSGLRTDPSTAKLVARLHWNRVRITPVDRSYEEVALFNGPRLELGAIVRRDGSVAYDAVPSLQKYAYGSNIANDWRVLALLTVVFVLMTAVWPLWRLRNLDVLVAASSVASVILLNAATVGRMVAVSYPALLYLALRCGWQAFASSRPSGAVSEPLFDRITSRWSADQRLRMLRVTACAAVLIVAMVGISSRGVVDVGYAVMEGATQLVHGHLPYGHIGDILHGDTYPIGSYLFYVPFAALTPVWSKWDSADLTLVVAVGAALLACVCAWLVARRPATGESARTTSRIAALRGVVAFLSFPPLLVTVSTGTTDVVLAAILVGALVLWRWPTVSTALLAAGAWFKLAPLALVPLWLAPLRGRGLLRAVAAIAGVSVVIVVPLVAIGGLGGISRMLHAISYQETRQSFNSAWSFVGSVPLQQLAQAATLALIVVGVIWLRRDPTRFADRRRLAALSATVLLALQISAGYWTYMYLVWVLPFLALTILSPADERPGR